jgi:hypothetical protein
MCLQFPQLTFILRKIISDEGDRCCSTFPRLRPGARPLRSGYESPGNEVGLDAPEIRITFGEDIVPLGAGAVKEEHSAYLKFGPGIDCQLA